MNKSAFQKKRKLDSDTTRTNTVDIRLLCKEAKYAVECKHIQAHTPTTIVKGELIENETVAKLIVWLDQVRDVSNVHKGF